jgi:hypothetical protein
MEEKKIDNKQEESYSINASNLIESDAQQVHDQKVPKKRGGRSSNVAIVDPNNSLIAVSPTNSFTDVLQ